MRLNSWNFLVIFLSLCAFRAHAYEDTTHVPNGMLMSSYKVAQLEGDDAYDPFADYSEFEEGAEEEEDMNFFRNGRFFTMGLIFGYRGFTQNYANMYTGSPDFGVYVSYFFDMRFALALGFITSDHQLNVATNPPIVGNMGLTDVMFHLKYYLNTQNVTRGLADLNPYLVGGFSEMYRTTHVSGQATSAKDNALSFDVGGGIEIPMLRNKMYFGVEGLYQILNFSDKNTDFPKQDGSDSGVNQTGDTYTLMGILGVNF